MKKKYKISLEHGQAEALVNHLEGCLIKIGGNLYEQLLGYSLVEILARLYPFLIDGASFRFGVSKSEAAALKLALAAFEWDEQNGYWLHLAQQQLPKTVVRNIAELKAPQIEYDHE